MTGAEDKQRGVQRGAAGGLKGLENASQAPGTFFLLYFFYFLLIYYTGAASRLPRHHNPTTSLQRARDAINASRALGIYSLQGLETRSRAPGKYQPK